MSGSLLPDIEQESAFLDHFRPTYENVTANLYPVLLLPTQGNNQTVAGYGEVNGNSTQKRELNSFYFYKAEQFTILWVLFTMIVLGNSAVLVALVVSKSRKSRMNFFIRQLAIADLSVGLINVSTDIAWRITVAWHAGNALCKLIRFLQAVVTYSSTYVLVALSIDRYDAITHPMNFSGSWKRARMLVVLAWMLSILFSLPTVFLFEEKPVEDIPQCWIDLLQWQWKVYMTLVALVLFVIPALIISACYAVIVWTIWTKSKLLIPIGHIPIRQSDDHRIITPRAFHEDHDCRRASSRGIIPRAKIKTVKMTFGIVFVFVICWSPYIIFDLLQVYGHIPKTQTNIAIATLIQSLAPLNSAANPVIYCLFSTHICGNLRIMQEDWIHAINREDWSDMLTIVCVVDIFYLLAVLACIAEVAEMAEGRRNFKGMTTHFIMITIKVPPFSWISGCLAACCPASRYTQAQRGAAGTVTTTLTHSSRRSASGVSLRHTIRLKPALANDGRKVAVSVV